MHSTREEYDAPSSANKSEAHNNGTFLQSNSGLPLIKLHTSQSTRPIISYHRKSRRDFLKVASGAAALPIGLQASHGMERKAELQAGKRLRFAVKWGMIDVDGPPAERFQLCSSLGFDGIELISPCQISVEELKAASAKTRLPIHGLVNDRHWQLPLSSASDTVRMEAKTVLEQAVCDAAKLGGHSVLLVPGVVGGDASHEEVWSRSAAVIREVLPLCSQYGVHILIENVWNGFCESAKQYRDYLDDIDSPWVGAYLDLGNCRKFGPTEDWIRALGSRIVKLDVKDWGASNGFCEIGEGDVNWQAVREALDDIGFSGWCTAEVDGGGRERLSDIRRRMDTVLSM